MVIFSHWVSTGFSPSWWIRILPSVFKFPLLYHHYIIEMLMIIDVMLCWPNFVSWLFNFHYECLTSVHWNASLSYNLVSQWIHSGLRILSFSKLNMKVAMTSCENICSFSTSKDMTLWAKDPHFVVKVFFFLYYSAIHT